MNGGSEVIIPLFGFLDITGEVITEWCIIGACDSFAYRNAQPA